jgi:hypothetical protein
MKHHDIEQNTDEWYQLRSGKLTMSKLGVVMAKYPNAFGEPAKKYAVNIAIEQITGKPIPSSYSNDAMQEGHVREPVAKAMYETETFQTVKNGGFFCNDLIGASPDGLPGEGTVEFKASITSFAHYERIRKQSIDSAYRWQCIGTLKYTEKPWLDFVSYCEDFPEGKQLFIHRVTPDMFQTEFEQIEERVAQFFALVEKSKETIINAKYL